MHYECTPVLLGQQTHKQTMTRGQGIFCPATQNMVKEDVGQEIDLWPHSSTVSESISTAVSFTQSPRYNHGSHHLSWSRVTTTLRGRDYPHAYFADQKTEAPGGEVPVFVIFGLIQRERKNFVTQLPGSSHPETTQEIHVGLRELT